MLQDNAVRKMALITLGFLSLFLLAQTLAEFGSLRFIGSQPGMQSQINAQGKGEIVAVPDVAMFSFTVSEESLAVKEAQDEAAKTMNAILAYLKKNGVAEKDIQTSGYNIYPRYEYDKGNAVSGAAPEYYPIPEPPPGKRNLAAYVTSESVTVKVRDLGNAGKLLSGIGELGATEVSGLSFDFDKRDELVKEARDKAIAEARENAKTLARALGVRLVRVLSYNEGGIYPIYAKSYAAEGRGGPAQATPEIPVGEDKIVSNVTITYEIK